MFKMPQISIFLSILFLSSAAATPQAPPGGKPKGGGGIVSPYQKDESGGSGRYKAGYVADNGLPKHTIYAPKSPPEDAMPIIVWREGSSPHCSLR
jgi:hypothetical protein